MELGSAIGSVGFAKFSSAVLVMKKATIAGIRAATRIPRLSHFVCVGFFMVFLWECV